MREIKFRAWDDDKKEFNYGDLINNYDGRVFIGEIVFDGTGDSLDLNGFGAHQISLKNIEQYTGLKDKNGVEIYEGDIVRSAKGSVQKIYYDERYGAFLCEDIMSFNNQLKDGWIIEGTDEVIGNIHEGGEENR